MKRFLLKVTIFLFYALLLQVVLPIMIDPFNVFHWKNVRANGVEPNKNYIKTNYILSNPNIFDGYLFGSSRAGAIHTEKMPGKIYNMHYSVGLPPEHLANLKTFVENRIFPKQIYIAVDNVSYVVDPIDHFTDPMRCPYELLYDDREHFYSLFLNPSESFQSILAILNRNSRKTNRDHSDFYTCGYSYGYNMISQFNWAAYVQPMTFKKNTFTDTIEALQEIADICREHGIKLIIFTNPMYKLMYEASIRNNYFEFLTALSEITDFYNFSSFNDVTLDNSNYLDESHYKAEIGDMIIDVICHGKKFPSLYEQGFGMKVTRENIDNFVDMLRKQAGALLQ